MTPVPPWPRGREARGLLESALWPEILPLLEVQDYARDGGHRNPRHRLELHDPEDRRLRLQLLALEVQCAACGRMIHPIRQRKGWRRLYIAVTCELTMTRNCARGRAASLEYERIIAAARDWKDPRQPDLLGLA